MFSSIPSDAFKLAIYGKNEFHQLSEVSSLRKQFINHLLLLPKYDSCFSLIGRSLSIIHINNIPHK